MVRGSVQRTKKLLNTAPRGNLVFIYIFLHVYLFFLTALVVASFFLCIRKKQICIALHLENYEVPCIKYVMQQLTYLSTVVAQK